MYTDETLVIIRLELTKYTDHVNSVRDLAPKQTYMSSAVLPTS
jgi:hypothetical protein